LAEQLLLRAVTMNPSAAVFHGTLVQPRQCLAQRRRLRGRGGCVPRSPVSGSE
jgi:hypothetical protein